MRGILAIALMILFAADTYGQLNSREYAITCLRIVELDSSESTKRVLIDLGQLNRISLGDAGESSRPDAAIKMYENYVDFFDTTYADSTVMALVKKDYCPLISAYAFVALVKSGNSRLTDSAIVELIMPFAKDTGSWINLDWGCGSHAIQTFDYLISLMSGKGIRGYFAQIKPLPYKYLDALLTERKSFYRRTDIYNRKMNWEMYRSYYLK